MNDQEQRNDNEEIHSKVLRAGRRTYFFDVRATKADDYYLTITESKKHTNSDGSFYYKKHKIYLYKEDFQDFKEMLGDVTDFIVQEKGEEVISETHQSDYQKKYQAGTNPIINETTSESEETNSYTDVNFEDI
jgi:hypothetical protein